MKYYAVKVGRKVGIYYSWEDCKEQVDKYPKAVFKSFTDIVDANEFIFGQKVSPIKTQYDKNSIQKRLSKFIGIEKESLAPDLE
jgi:viroplasmin and RNaseH domain-containing protein